MSSAGNPLAPLAAAGDLGLSLAAKKDAADIADRARKKKLQDQKDLANAGAGGMPGAAFQMLSGAGSM